MQCIGGQPYKGRRESTMLLLSNIGMTSRVSLEGDTFLTTTIGSLWISSKDSIKITWMLRNTSKRWNYI